MSKRDYRLYIEDILECIGKIKRYAQSLDLIEFSEDDKTVDAVIRNFEIIGEASRQLPEEFKRKYPEVDWREMIDFRNVIIHGYFAVNMSIIWDIIQNELLPLENEIQKVMEKM
jgi:uncharacterized protein with HEPN domain